MGDRDDERHWYDEALRWQHGRYEPVEADDNRAGIRLVDMARAEPVFRVAVWVGPESDDQAEYVIWQTRSGSYVLERPVDSELLCLETCADGQLYGLLVAVTAEPECWEKLPPLLYGRLRAFIEKAEI